ncbi:PHNX-like protein [Mya arenaria]|uniref:PHNX-like protein n=1 Tax=Mya arenaria TaxID=6604 RepID=A0ABY7EN93_MYAAR|nr:PHNX-like protein [Mya arenaria]WAR11488.1 PHNX-like protein [Mya arenaria]
MSQHFRFIRRYTGPLRAAILDWSGTTADKYVLAPAVVFADVFEKHKVPISMKEARLPMGLRKDLHIKEITEIPEVRQRWKEVYGRDPNQGDVDNMFKDFVPMQLGCLRKYTDLIPGTIGSSTGFVRSMVDILLEEGKKQGFHPDCTVAGDEVVNGARPKPFMVYRNLDLLDVATIQSVVKVDDTVSGIGEALNAGCWGVGVARYSNYMDINTLDQESQLSEAEIQTRLEHSRDLLRKAGAHYVVDSIKDLPEVCADINTRLARGESP